MSTSNLLLDIIIINIIIIISNSSGISISTGCDKLTSFFLQTAQFKKGS
jgi:hypothetical protein